MDYNKFPLTSRIIYINKLFIFGIALLSGIGFLMLFDAAGHALQPWASPQILRFFLGILLMLIIALSPLPLWIRLAYVLYFISLLMLVAVALFGHVGMGAKRWIKIMSFRFQPSESMRISLILALACYFHRHSADEIKRPRTLIAPLLMISLPAILILRQPDLGTAIMLFLTGAILLFAAGIQLRYFISAGLLGLISIPIVWNLLHTYQKNRVLTFLNPERDPFGAGYHILQSKIAIGSAGLHGKGFGLGTQSHLKFLPEKHTDFIFGLFAEEFGFIGSLGLIGVYIIVFAIGIFMALRANATFPRLVIIGFLGSFFIYMFINMAMVMGLLPVVGVPLPLVSYGGTSLLTLMMSFGFMLNADVYRDQKIPRYYN